jgi:hypothetical protein
VEAAAIHLAWVVAGLFGLFCLITFVGITLSIKGFRRGDDVRGKFVLASLAHFELDVSSTANKRPTTEINAVSGESSTQSSPTHPATTTPTSAVEMEDQN